MTKPTPGPWTVEAPDERPIILSGDGGMVADMIEREDSRETQANARLISAAPDLLEALEMLRETWTGTSYAQWTTEMHAADYAIAKARGQ